MTEYIQGILTILSLVNPMICAAIFTQLSAGQSMQEKIASATKAALAIAVILCGTALIGAQLLKVFGISLSAFQVAGGIVLVWMGFLMLSGNSSPTTDNASPQQTSLSPLILFAASPGTITGVITLAVSHTQDKLPLTALVSVIVVVAITWLVLVLVARKSGDQKSSLVHDVSSRFMGLIVLAMGVQFVLKGIEEFFQKV